MSKLVIICDSEVIRLNSNLVLFQPAFGKFRATTTPPTSQSKLHQ